MNGKELLGEMLVSKGVITRKQLEEAIKLQEREGIKIGNALVKLGYLSWDQIYRFLGAQYRGESWKSLGQILLERGVVTREQLSEAFKAHEETGISVGKALVNLGYTTWYEIYRALSNQYEIAFMRISDIIPSPSLFNLIPWRICKDLGIVVIDRIGDVLSIATSEPLEPWVIEELEKTSGCKISQVFATPEEIEMVLESSRPKQEEEERSIAISRKMEELNARLNALMELPGDKIAREVEGLRADLLGAGSIEELEEIERRISKIEDEVRGILFGIISNAHTKWFGRPLQSAPDSIDLLVRMEKNISRLKELELLAFESPWLLKEVERLKEMAFDPSKALELSISVEDLERSAKEYKEVILEPFSKRDDKRLMLFKELVEKALKIDAWMVLLIPSYRGIRAKYMNRIEVLDEPYEHQSWIKLLETASEMEKDGEDLIRAKFEGREYMVRVKLRPYLSFLTVALEIIRPETLVPDLSRFLDEEEADRLLSLISRDGVKIFASNPNDAILLDSCIVRQKGIGMRIAWIGRRPRFIFEGVYQILEDPSEKAIRSILSFGWEPDILIVDGVTADLIPELRLDPFPNSILVLDSPSVSDSLSSVAISRIGRVSGFASWRLVFALCPGCRVSRRFHRPLPLEGPFYSSGPGCEICDGKGKVGRRTAIIWMMEASGWEVQSPRFLDILKEIERDGLIRNGLLKSKEGMVDLEDVLGIRWERG